MCRIRLLQITGITGRLFNQGSAAPNRFYGDERGPYMLCIPFGKAGHRIVIDPAIVRIGSDKDVIFGETRSRQFAGEETLEGFFVVDVKTGKVYEGLNRNDFLKKIEEHLGSRQFPDMRTLPGEKIRRR